MNLQKLQDAACSDGSCVFKITPEMRKGMRTNGGCCCLKDMTYGIGHRKTHGVMELSRIASDAEAALAAKDAEIERLRRALEEIIDHVGYDYCEDEDTGQPCGGCPWCIANKALEARDE